jgi:geranylgeranyl transferase type-2 subunit beta
VLSSLATLDRLHWINAEKLKNFILECQDDEGGGIGDRPNDVVDVYHTFFGVGGWEIVGKVIDGFRIVFNGIF